ncbi:MAG: FRG domain-containing protein [Delftia acidovorans]|jgi:hypothetical protein|nr:FRG domain-containing protein [Delftia acidovorans]
MFHFLVTSDKGAWEGKVEIYSRSRFLEYTPDDIVAKFSNITSEVIEQLKKMPCLCAYEGEYDIRVAKVKSIEVQAGSVRIEIDFDNRIPPIPFDDFSKHKKRFGIHEWEFSRTHWAIKSGDLLEKLRESSIAFVDQETALADVFEDFAPAEDVSGLIVQKVPTVVRSVSEFIAQVNKLNDATREAFYRGHTDIEYQLKPSVFRTNKQGVPLYRNSEHQMFREVLVSNSFDFKDDTSTLDRLVRMQHYELPTRLLDITANPLIALFFAVFSKQQTEEKLGVPGQVILFQLSRDHIKYFDSDTASCIANLALLSAADKNSIDFTGAMDVVAGQTFELNKFNVQPSIRRLLHYIKNEKPYFQDRIVPSSLGSVICVKGKKSNDRISSQAGAFLLFGHEAVLAEETTDTITIHRINVENKRAVLEELERLDITESTVFPNLVATCNHIKTRYQTKF